MRRGVRCGEKRWTVTTDRCGVKNGAGSPDATGHWQIPF